MVARLAVQKLVDSEKKMENGIIKIRYLLGCGVSKMKGGGDICEKFAKNPVFFWTASLKWNFKIHLFFKSLKYFLN